MFKTFNLKRIDFVLLTLIISLNVFGIFAVGSARPDLQIKQIEGMVVGLALMLVISALDYHKIIYFAWVYYVINIVLLYLVISIGSTGGGAQRWLTIGGFTFQPSEAAKILLILFYAKFIMKYKDRIRTIPVTALSVALILIPFYLIWKQPDMSTSIMVVVIFSVMMFVGGISFRLVAGIFAVSLPTALILFNMVLQEDQTLLSPYQRNRILAFLHPEDFADTTAYQTIYSMMAIGSGKLLGKGYNTNSLSSLLNSGYISQSQTDFIFTVIGEEFGFIGACAVVALIAAISIKCFLNVRTARDMAGMVICAGMGAWIGFQGIMNIGVATGTFPNTGIPLPFVSYGLTSLWSLYMGIGFLLNVRMQSAPVRSAKTVGRIGGIPDMPDLAEEDAMLT